MPAWLFALLAAAFVLYADDYATAGMLPELPRDLPVSEGQVGQLVTVSVTLAVAAVALARIPRRVVCSSPPH